MRLFKIIKTTMHDIVNIVAIIRSKVRFSPTPNIIGIGPRKRINPETFVMPEIIVSSIRIIIPATIRRKATKKSFRTGENVGISSSGSALRGAFLSNLP